jgi:6-pyruvoyltetrahydropterin/6-carboxytetrahydropterin synthase
LLESQTEIGESMSQYAIRVYKEYFNFAASHFVLFKDGSREPLHGHNYRVSMKADALELDSDMVFDFLDIKPIVREVCDSLDHKLLLPADNPNITVTPSKEITKNYLIETKDESIFSIPQEDVLILPISNTTAERLAIYLANEVNRLTKQRFDFTFKTLEIEVEETRGQCAIYKLEN